MVAELELMMVGVVAQLSWMDGGLIDVCVCGKSLDVSVYMLMILVEEKLLKQSKHTPFWWDG